MLGTQCRAFCYHCLLAVSPLLYCVHSPLLPHQTALSPAPHTPPYPPSKPGGWNTSTSHCPGLYCRRCRPSGTWGRWKRNQAAPAVEHLGIDALNGAGAVHLEVIIAPVAVGAEGIGDKKHSGVSSAGAQFSTSTRMVSTGYNRAILRRSRTARYHGANILPAANCPLMR